MTISLDRVPRSEDGTWSHDADALVIYRRRHPAMTLQQAAQRYPAIPAEVLKSLFEKRKK